MATQIDHEVGSVNLLQVKSLQELIEEIRRCGCTQRCTKCLSALDRMDTIVDRAYSDAVRMGLKKGKKA